jgi:hypothetical protein
VTSSVYANHSLTGRGGGFPAIESNASSSVSSIFLGFYAGSGETSDSFGAYAISLLDYSTTTKNTTIRALGGLHAVGLTRIALASGLYNQTTAVSSIEFLNINNPTGTNFIAGSRFSLYGIKG